MQLIAQLNCFTFGFICLFNYTNVRNIAGQSARADATVKQRSVRVCEGSLGQLRGNGPPAVVLVASASTPTIPNLIPLGLLFASHYDKPLTFYIILGGIQKLNSKSSTGSNIIYGDIKLVNAYFSSNHKKMLYFFNF